MPGNFILKQWDEQTEVFIGCLAFVRRKPSRKVAHDMRVSIKKLRSHTQLCNELNEGKKEIEFDQIATLFRIAGRYRDIEMSLVLLGRFTKKGQVCPSSFIKELRTVFRLARGWTQTASLEPHEKELASVSEKMHDGLGPFSDDDLVKQIGKLAEKKIDELKKIIDDYAKNAHEIRKLLKQLYYWLKCCPNNPVFNKKQKKILDQALTCLGNAQDHFVLLKKLKDFRKEYLVKNTNEHALARSFEEICKVAQEQLLQQAKEKTESLIKDGKLRFRE